MPGRESHGKNSKEKNDSLLMGFRLSIINGPERLSSPYLMRERKTIGHSVCLKIF